MSHLMHRILINLTLAMILCIAYSSSGHAYTCSQQNQDQFISEKLSLLFQNLEKIKLALGQEHPPKPTFIATNVNNREIYHESTIIYHKINKLAFEISGIYKKIPTNNLPENNLCAAEFYINQSLIMLEPIAQRLNIQLAKKSALSSEKKTKSDIFMQILMINSQVNQLTYQKTTPSNVYGQVRLSVKYLKSILSACGIDNDFKKNSHQFINIKPTQVYANLLNDFSLLEKIFSISNLPIIKIQTNTKSNIIRPDDVLGLAKLILSEVEFLNQQIVKDENTDSNNYGYKTPSEIYYQTQLLNINLSQLYSHVKKHPNWLQTKTCQ